MPRAREYRSAGRHKSAPFLDLRAGEVYKAEDLIGATLIANMNDACNILAYYCATTLLNSIWMLLLRA
jgi:D-alanyl-D-alanine carboxypeptidase